MVLWCQQCLLLVFYHSLVATITLTSSVDARQAACPEEVMTYTCTVTQAASITWTAAPVLVGTSVRFRSISPSDEWQLSCSDTSSPVQCADLDYQATLTSVGIVDMIGAADLMSTFRFTARAELNGTVVQCSTVNVPNAPPDSQVLNVAGELWLPSVSWGCGEMYTFLCSIILLTEMLHAI